MLLHKEPTRAASAEESPSACCHHWIIEPANGPISRGVCRTCLEVREFKNSIAGMERDVQYLSPNSSATASSRLGASGG